MRISTVPPREARLTTAGTDAWDSTGSIAGAQVRGCELEPVAKDYGFAMTLPQWQGPGDLHAQ